MENEGTTVFGGITVLSSIRQQSLIMANLPYSNSIWVKLIHISDIGQYYRITHDHAIFSNMDKGTYCSRLHNTPFTNCDVVTNLHRVVTEHSMYE